MLRRSSTLFFSFLCPLLLYFFFLSAILPSVFGFGLAYPSDSLAMTAKPNTIHQMKYYVVSPAGHNAAISVSGDFAQYAKYDRLIKTTESLTPFFVTFEFPSAFDKPGMHQVDVLAQQAQQNGDGPLSYVVGASVPVIIRVLYPRDYLELTGFTAEPQRTTGEPVLFTLTGVNYGEKEISHAEGIISIFSNTTEIETISTNSLSLLSEKDGAFQARWDPSKMMPGEYKAVGVIQYGKNQTPVKELTLFVGDEEVIVRNYTRAYTNDSVNRFFLEVMSRWNTPIDFSAGLLFSKEEKDYGYFKAPSEKLEPWTPQTLEGFVDTRGFPLGNYNLNISLFSGQKKRVYQGHARVIAPSEKQPRLEQPFSLSSSLSSPIILVLVSVILLLALLNVILLVAYRKQR